ncbi:MAG: class I tRNA ligase family protein [Thermoguttaceae bacterium]
MEIPKQYDPLESQQKWTPFWIERGFFVCQTHGTKPAYTIVIPPPNVTGALHLGHALNNTLQDILIRTKRMQGFETLWVPGVDHAGIATQAVVERRLFEEEKKTRHDIGRAALVQRIWDWKEQYQTRILSQLKEMGCSCDWSKTRFTLDDVCANVVRHFFFKLFAAQLIYRGKRLVNWDTHLQTAVSDDEVIFDVVAGNFWYIRYPVVNPKRGEPEFVTVATTRPETMLGDTAVAVHPDPRTALHEIEAKLTEPEEIAAVKKRRDEMLPQLEQLAAMARDGRKLLLPLVNREIPLITDNWAKPDKGTGCVKITPAHDPNDYEVGLRHSLPMPNILNKDGTINSVGGVYAGLKVKAARERVVADLEAAGLLEKVEEREIDLAHSDRSKTPIEPFLHDQWFVKMDDLAQQAMDVVRDENSPQHVNIVPPRYAKGYLDWLSEKRDWPIGRQLWWGHQIPIWSCDGSATENDLQTAFANRNDVVWQRDEASGAWWICSEREDIAENAIAGFRLVREEDVLDTWFSSALWPLSTLGFQHDTQLFAAHYPTSVLVTSRDIITLWVARMVIAGLFNTGQKPFHDVYIHPKILDKYGEGMSKSKGNGVDPISVMQKFGADALRFAIASLTTESQDVRLSLDFECPHCSATIEQTKKNRTLPRIDCPKCGKPFRTQWAERDEDRALPEAAVVGERFEAARNFCNKLWNAARFVMMNCDDVTVDASKTSATSAGDFLEDRWILSRLATVTAEVTTALDEYRFADVARTLHDFAWDEFCSFYLEIVKSRLADASQKPQAMAVLVRVLETLLKLLHPIIPFVTEELWHRLGETLRLGREDESVSRAAYPVSNAADVSRETESQFAVFQEVLRAVREVRASRNVPPKTVISFAVRCEANTASLLEPMRDYFTRMASAKLIACGESVTPPPLVSSVALAGFELFVDLADLIDVAAEREKKTQEIDKLEKLIAAKEAKLSGDFVSKAPAAVVAKEQESLVTLQTQLVAARDALEKLLAKK